MFRTWLKSDLNEPVNIGNPGEMTVQEMAEKILQATRSQSKIIHKDLPEDDPKVRQPDITQAKKHLGWQPVVKLDDGLNKTLEYFRKKIGNCKYDHAEYHRTYLVGKKFICIRCIDPY